MFSTYIKVFTILALVAASDGNEGSGPIYKLAVNGIIHTITEQFLINGIEEAEEANAELVLIQLQTPGGALDATRSIVEKMLSSEVPIVIYVAPPGARAASAGFILALGADVVAMAPGTNIGAASPVTGTGQDIEETMEKKVTSDTAAYVRSLAAKRGRNVELAEKAVLEAESWTEKEALDANLIDYVAANQAELLAELDGATAKRFDGSEVVLETQGKEVVSLEMSLPQRILSVVAHPNVAYILLTLGFLGLYFELANPGAILPGVIGVISLILAFFALQVLPVNYAGLLLILVGIGLLIGEAFTPSFGALGLGGVVALVLGSLILFEEQPLPTPALELSWSVILPVVAVLVVMFGLLARLVIQAQLDRAVTGDVGIIGESGIAETEIAGMGKIFVHGEFWNARSPENISKGERVRVTGIDGLVLDVERDDKDRKE